MKTKIGLELECNVVDSETLGPIVNFNNTADFHSLNEQQKKAGFNPIQTEFDASTIEFTTTATTSLSAAFAELKNNLSATTAFLATKHQSLLMCGINPLRSRDQLVMTDKQRAYDSLPLMAENGGPLFYCSFQVNLALPRTHAHHLMQLIHSLFYYCWPLSVITQSTPLFAGQITHYQSFRTRLIDAISGSRTGMYSSEIDTIEKLNNFIKTLPGEKKAKRQQNTWFDILPKPLACEESPWRIEIRMPDTASLDRLQLFAETVQLTYHALLDKCLRGESLAVLGKDNATLFRDAIAKEGVAANIITVQQEEKTLTQFIKEDWSSLLQSTSSATLIDNVVGVMRNTQSHQLLAADNIKAYLREWQSDDMVRLKRW